MESPSKTLQLIDHKQTKLIKINNRNMYKNPAIDVVFDTNGEFYSNKKQKGFQLLNGKKVHYVLNLNGNIIKGNTTKKSLINIMLGKLPPKQIKHDAKQQKPSVVKKVDTRNNQIMDTINMIESQLNDLKKLIA